jgi:hypothetical protein
MSNTEEEILEELNLDNKSYTLDEIRAFAIEKLSLVKNEVEELQTDVLINRGMIKPKHINNTDISYKPSNYLRDLIGEE